MKFKSMLLLVMLFAVATFTLVSCDLPFGDSPDETTAAPAATTTAAATTTTASVTTTAPVTTTASVTTAPPNPFEGVALADGAFTYDGTAKALTVTGAPDGAVVTYAYAKNDAAVDAAIDAGTYTVTATISYNGESEIKTATLTINKKAVAVGATFANGTAAYTGAAMSYEAATGFDAALFNVAYTYSADMINAGEYDVTATFTLKDAANYEIDGAATATAKFVITKAPIDLSAVAFPAAGTNYFKGTAFDFEVLNLPAGVAVAYTYTLDGAAADALLNVGTYTVTATFTSANYEIAADSAITAEFTILKALADMSGITLADQSLAYTGAALEYVVAGLPAGVDAVITYKQADAAASPINAGTYTAVISFVSDGYTIPAEWAEKTATLVITPKDVTIAGAVFEGDAFVYDGSTKTYAPVTGYDSTIFNVTYAIEGDQVNAGSFTATATFALVDAANYNLVGETTMTATYTIAKAKATIGTIADGGDVYNGEAKKHEAATGYDAAIFNVTYTYSGNMTDAGEYTVTATFTLKDAANYEIEGETAVTAKFVITPKKVAVGATMAGASYVYDATEKAYNEAIGFDAAIFDVAYTVSGDRVKAGSFTVTATFTVKSANYEIDGENTVSATYEIAKADIEVTVSFPEANTGVYNGSAHVYEIVDLPEGLTVSYEASGNMTDAGTYTVTATIKKDENYNAKVVVGEYTITPKEVSIADAAPAWNVDGADQFANGYAYKTDGETACSMVLANEADLAAKGLAVTYATTLLPSTSFETEKDVVAPVTAYGTYKTVATFTALNGNYKLVGDATMEIVWGVYDDVWSPLVK